MSYTWTRMTNYRPDWLPSPTNPDKSAMNRTYALKRWVRGHVAQIDLAVCAGLVLAGVKVFG